MTRIRRLRNQLSLGRAKFFFRKVQHPIPRGALVVDIGSGGDPHPRADVLVDRTTDSGGERTVAFRQSAPTVVADVHALPFRDHAFGYSICSHLLEHVDDPKRAAAEISRTSRAGYIETPSELHEKLMPIGWHRWFVRIDGDRLIFDAKPSPFLDERLGDYFRTRWARDQAFMSYVWSHVDDLFVRHHWSGQLEVEASDPPAWGLDDGDGDELDTVRDSEAKRLMYRALAAVRYRRRPKCRSRA
jgi:SAM-dependent methyltransferase